MEAHLVELEGVLTGSMPGRLEGPNMHLEVSISPWRTIGVGEIQTTTLLVIVTMDYDMADAWMQWAEAGKGVRLLVDRITLASGSLQVAGDRLREHPIADALAAVLRIN